jgi:hypothetical protein
MEKKSQKKQKSVDFFLLCVTTPLALSELGVPLVCVHAPLFQECSQPLSLPYTSNVMKFNDHPFFSTHKKKQSW